MTIALDHMAQEDTETTEKECEIGSTRHRMTHCLSYETRSSMLTFRPFNLEDRSMLPMNLILHSLRLLPSLWLSLSR